MRSQALTWRRFSVNRIASGRSVHGPKGPTGLDLAELGRVTDEHQLRPHRRGDVVEAVEGAGPDHAGLVDHDHRPGVKRQPPRVELSEQPRHGDRLDSRTPAATQPPTRADNAAP